ncbi:unnamed protein product [Rhizoctonia solani]|uniref:Uncharacterized protein n=1 Tax=Rhizoctonia solani TaxID=456999 RepID=A0A8H3GMP0_9AGAM|nr:unnamed protein product [Rhizoctonia solani]
MGEGDDLDFSWELFPVSVKGHVNPTTLEFSANIGVTIPFPGHQEMFSVNGNFKEGATTAINIAGVKGSIGLYSKGKELWIKPELESPFFPTMNQECKISDLP